MQIADLLLTCKRVLLLWGEHLGAMVANPHGGLYAPTLVSALLIAGLFLYARRYKSRRPRLAVLARALLPRRWTRSRSSRADFGLLLFNSCLLASLLGWAIVSSGLVERSVGTALAGVFGGGALVTVPSAVLATVLMIALYLAYEVAYFANHFLSHHIPLLWHFHRVHHSAETLSPVTNYRVHPIDTLVFYNFVALSTGIASGIVRQIFAAPAGAEQFEQSNAILIVASYLLIHLHHSEVWIPFTGRLGRLILSPAHHQLHHSTDSRHFNRNFGFTLAIFDRLAGTLLVPEAKRERLRFGAGPHDYDPHSPAGLLVMPFVDAMRPLRRLAAGRPSENKAS